MIDGRHRVLPELRLLRHQRAEAPRDRPHVTVRQLVPSLCKGVRELRRVLVETLGNAQINRVGDHGHVGRRHKRCVLLRWIVRVRHGARRFGILGRPLFATACTLYQFPLVTEQVVEVAVVPLHGIVGPCAFQSAADGVAAFAAGKAVLPAKPLLLNAGRFGFRADVLARVGGAVAFAKRMTTRNQRDRLFVVHRHAGEGFPNVFG